MSAVRLPLISVAMPAFNAEATIGDAIQSVLDQSHKNVEIVVCDDASTDDTCSVVESIDDSRVRLLRSDTNLGPGPARDNAIQGANGDWTALSDADDLWHPRRLEFLLQAARDDNDVMVFDDCLVCHQTDRGLVPFKRARGPRAFGAKGGLPIDVPAATWARSSRYLMQPLIPSKALRALNIRHTGLRCGEDNEFFLRAIAGGLRLRYLPEAYYYYRMTPGSMSTTLGKSRLMRDMLAGLLPLFDDQPDVQAALRYRIDYRDFTMDLKSRRFGKAIAHAVKQPALVYELLSRAPAELVYPLHRMLHRGDRRLIERNPDA